MIRFFYNLLFPFALLVFLPGYLRKARRRGNYRENFGQRFGCYDAELRARLAAHPHTWIHAVSVGEVVIALKLLTKLRARDPQFRSVLTTTTSTGYSVARQGMPDGTIVLYNPLDFWPVTRRAFRAIRPQAIVLVEAEVWPNLAAEARNRGIPLALVNARLSDRSERRFRKFAAIVRPTFRCLDLVCVQEARDVTRWEALGVRPSVIRHTGSIKYDPSETQMDAEQPRQVLRELGIAETRPILLGGSTHPGEEEILAQVFQRLRAELPDALLILAPRHVERSAEVAAMLRQQGLRFVARSAAAAPGAGPVDVILLDTTGELRHWYAAATAVFIGKSLTTHGGQNPVEPIMAGRPVIFGPHMENFAALAKSLLENDGAVLIANAEELAAAALDLLRNAARRDALVRQAAEVLSPHRGATERTAALVLAGKSLARSE